MRIRFKLRGVMLAIALVAVLIGPAWRYAQELRMRSRYYAFRVASAGSARQNALAEAKGPGLRPAEREHLKKEAAWHAAQAASFKQGVHRPWLDVREPEPLPPLVVEPAPEEDDPAMAALSRLKDKMSPEQYAEIQEKLRDLARMRREMNRRMAERRQKRSQARMGAGFTPEPPPPVSIDKEIMRPVNGGRLRGQGVQPEP